MCMWIFAFLSKYVLTTDGDDAIRTGNDWDGGWMLDDAPGLIFIVTIL